MSKGETLSAFLAFLAERFSFSVRPGGFLLAVFRGDLSDMGHLIYISISHERRGSAPANQHLGDQFSPDRWFSVADSPFATSTQQRII
jgi:hypothetical protein